MKQLLNDLGPWHFDFEITDGIRTSLSTNRSKVSFRDPEIQWDRIMSHIDIDIPNSNILDCGCNCGAMCFFAAEAGFNSCVGVDAHKHWIRQAEFIWNHQSSEVQRKITFINERIQDYTSNIEFDLVLFNGIFYHLPDPVYTLQRITKLIKPNGWIVVNSAADGNNEGKLKVQFENTSSMSGVDGLCMRPDGPGVIITILKWLGFDQIETIYWKKGRTEIIAKKG